MRLDITEEDMQDLTWEEYLSLGEKLKTKGHMLQTYNPNDIAEFQIMLQSAGKWFTNEKGEADFIDNRALEECCIIDKIRFAFFICKPFTGRLKHNLEAELYFLDYMFGLCPFVFNFSTKLRYSSM